MWSVNPTTHSARGDRLCVFPEIGQALLGWHRSPEQPLRCALDSRPAKQGGADVERRVEDCRQALFRLKRVGLKSPTSLRSPGVHSDSSSALCVLVRHKIRRCSSNGMNGLRSSPGALGHWSCAVPRALAYSMVSDSNWRRTRDVEPARENGPDALTAHSSWLNNRAAWHVTTNGVQRI